MYSPNRREELELSRLQKVMIARLQRICDTGETMKERCGWTRYKSITSFLWINVNRFPWLEKICLDSLLYPYILGEEDYKTRVIELRTGLDMHFSQ